MTEIEAREHIVTLVLAMKLEILNRGSIDAFEQCERADYALEIMENGWRPEV